MEIQNNGISQYGDTFIEGVVHNQRKTDERLVKAIKKAQNFREDAQLIRGMMLALKIIRGESYDERTPERTK